MGIDPRTMGILGLILGAWSILVGLYELFSLNEPMHVSSPWPQFTEWLIGTFGTRGLHLLVVIIAVLFGAFFLRYGWRALTSQSRADGP